VLPQIPVLQGRSVWHRTVALFSDRPSRALPTAALLLPTLCPERIAPLSRFAAADSSRRSWEVSLRSAGTSNKKTPYPDPNYSTLSSRRAHPSAIVAMRFQCPLIPAIGALCRPSNRSFQASYCILLRAPVQLHHPLHPKASRPLQSILPSQK
jgi:hypothetical protein